MVKKVIGPRRSDLALEIARAVPAGNEPNRVKQLYGKCLDRESGVKPSWEWLELMLEEGLKSLREFAPILGDQDLPIGTDDGPQRIRFPGNLLELAAQWADEFGWQRLADKYLSTLEEPGVQKLPFNLLAPLVLPGFEAMRRGPKKYWERFLRAVMAWVPSESTLPSEELTQFVFKLLKFVIVQKWLEDDPRSSARKALVCLFTDPDKGREKARRLLEMLQQQITGSRREIDASLGLEPNWHESSGCATTYLSQFSNIELPPMGTSIKLVGKGLVTGQVHEPILDADQVATLEATPEKAPFDGDPQRFRLGIEALRLGLAYEYDPYFALSIARVDPLPHQLEAVYDHFLRLPRIRFLLADDPGAGKTIMAGLLIKELKIRGLIKRTLIVTPASLSFQWQRELKDKFRENFDIIRSDVLRSNYGSNPWQEKNQVITSVSWVSRIDDAKESLMRSSWDLIIVDEAHKMSAYSADKKTLAFQLGEALSERTDHYLLMTATPHKGDPENFCLFLGLLDRDVYGDVRSLEEAMKQHDAPFYLRRIKEALVTFPDPETGKVKTLFAKRNVQTTEFQIDDEEWDFYDALTRYVEDQSIKAASDNSPRGRALGFTMAMLQRRFASSVYAVRRTLERMKDKRERILADPEGYRQDQLARKLPEDFEDLPEEEREKIVAELEDVVASVDPIALREEILQLGKLIAQARELEEREVERKLVVLKAVLTKQGVFNDPKMKLLLFTEHKDTLDFLAADGRDGRPLGKLLKWGLSVSQIHGGMKIGDRDTPGSRIYAEREFRESCQVLVATEAAGEGINLQFCWFMINYDIPWNPVRLEQRMGRIHRYGQEKDCLILNFVSTNTREGRVLQKLFERIRKIEDDLDPKRMGTVFNVLGDVFSANQLEKMLRDMYARNLTEDVIKSRIVEQVDTDRFRKIAHSALEGLAKRELNLSAILCKSAEAKERRLVPEVVEDFFLQAAPLTGIYPKEA